jgi:hypothetical protein
MSTNVAFQQAPLATEAAVEQLRAMVRYFDYMNETFNTRFTLPELQKIHAFSRSEQGKWVPEFADSWPQYLLRAVLRGRLGAPVSAALVKRAGEGI